MPANESTPSEGQESIECIDTPAAVGEVFLEPTEVKIGASVVGDLTAVSVRATELNLRVILDKTEAVQLVEEVESAMGELEDREE